MPCSKCGAENPERQKFRGDCGAPLDNRCWQWGADNRVRRRFCCDCGAARVSGRSAQPPSPSQPAAEIRPTGQVVWIPHLMANAAIWRVLFTDPVGSTEIAA